jgi:hypothetical protein
MTRNRNELNTTSPLTAHEVCLVLMDVARGKRIMIRSSIQSWNEIYHGLMPVEIDGWQLTLFNDCDTLDYYKYSRSPDGICSTACVSRRINLDALIVAGQQICTVLGRPTRSRVAKASSAQ